MACQVFEGSKKSNKYQNQNHRSKHLLVKLLSSVCLFCKMNNANGVVEHTQHKPTQMYLHK